MTAPNLPSGSPLPAPSGRNMLLSVLAVLGCFLIFFLILILAYIPLRRAAPIADLDSIDKSDQWKYTPQGRLDRLAELHNRERAAATKYGWIDEKAGIVQLPIDRAMELVVQEHAGAQK